MTPSEFEKKENLSMDWIWKTKCQQYVYLMRGLVFNSKFCVFLLSPSNHFDLTFDKTR
jgi:hypothetical protein